MAKRVEQERELFAGAITFFADCFGVSNKGFIASPFLRCLSNSELAPLALGLADGWYFLDTPHDGWHFGPN
jgi:hypothetical protein